MVQINTLIYCIFQLTAFGLVETSLLLSSVGSLFINQQGAASVLINLG